MMRTDPWAAHYTKYEAPSTHHKTCAHQVMCVYVDTVEIIVFKAHLVLSNWVKRVAEAMNVYTPQSLCV